MADAHGSGPCVRKDVGVQLPPRPLAWSLQSQVGFTQVLARVAAGGPHNAGRRTGQVVSEPARAQQQLPRTRRRTRQDDARVRRGSGCSARWFVAHPGAVPRCSCSQRSSSGPPAWEPLTGIGPSVLAVPAAVSGQAAAILLAGGGGAARHPRTRGCERRRVGHGGCRAAERVPSPCGPDWEGWAAQTHLTPRMSCLLAGSGSDGTVGRGLRPLDAAHVVPPFVQRNITASNDYELQIQHVQLEGGILIESNACRGTASGRVMELLSASPTRWSRARAALTGWVRGWPVWAAPAPLLGYLLTVVTLAVMVGGYRVATTPLLGSELAAFGLLVGCGVVALEATRRSGEPAGVSRDLLSAWTVPIAVLLPPLYALLAPVVWTGVTQLRVGRSPLHRRLFSAAVIGLEGYGRATVFQLLAGGTLAHVVGHGGGWVALALLATVAIGFVGVQLNAVVVAVAVRLSSPEVRWRQLLGQRADVLLDLLELTVGTVIAAAWIASPATAILALPAMVLLHRTLTHDQLRAAARIDAKTGLLNAATWEEEATREISRAARTNTPLTVLIADLDHFKEVNDQHGHLVGDQVLVAVAAALQSGSRGYDVLGRFGGEEFTIALPGTDVDEAAQITGRLRQLVGDAVVPVGRDFVQVTVSIGAAVLGRHGQDLTDLLVAADLALYRAKAAGRNQVSFAPTP